MESKNIVIKSDVVLILFSLWKLVIFSSIMLAPTAKIIPIMQGFKASNSMFTNLFLIFFLKKEAINKIKREYDDKETFRVTGGTIRLYRINVKRGQWIEIDNDIEKDYELEQ